MMVINSSQNTLIKEVKSLKDKKNRDEKKEYFIEGIRFVEEALKEKADIKRILVCDAVKAVKGGEEILRKVQEAKLEVVYVSDKVFRELSDTKTPQGILAVIREKRYAANQILTENNFLMILDSITDPGNMGTIIRTADAAGVSGIILSKGCVDVYNPKVLRSTMGSIFRIPVFSCEDLVETVEWLKSENIRVYAAHLDGRTSYFQLEMKKNIAVIIGNEANGISNEVALAANELVKIPMLGRAESLNASVAASLLMYEVVRQRMG
ncbi:MAG: 23S rRNA (guanosine(2251)-2'-O)-methyltransferase RlmB [Clostridia bacterium]|nr:23S rRNA (guanosine(2251)-2'-O)-methyltransferase RlmB [Clostridia bacterium]